MMGVLFEVTAVGDFTAVGIEMSQGLWFLLFLVLFCLLAVFLVFLYRAAKHRGETGLIFWSWVVLYGILASYLGFLFAWAFLSVGVGSGAVSWELLLKGAVFSCIFGVIFGLLHLGGKRLPVMWQVFLQAVMFCCMMGVLLWFFYAGVRNIDGVRVIFLELLVCAVVLKLFVALLRRQQDDTLWQKSLRVLNFLLFCGILGSVLVFVALGGQNLGLSWLWFSHMQVLIGINAFLSPFLYVGARCARVMGEVFFKTRGGHSR